MGDAKALDATIRAYDDNLDAYIERTGHISMESVIDKFISYLSGNSVLSVGCGFGKDERLFAEKEIAISGIDLSSAMIEEADKRVPSGAFYVMDMRKLDFPDDNFDGVYCCASIHHLAREDAPGALSEMHRVLRDNSLIFVNVKEGADESCRMLGTGEIRETFYSQDEFEGMLKDAGFDILETQITGSSTDKNKKRWLNYFCRKR